MIVTVTPSPALDRTYLVPSLRPGELHRASASTVEASGKGVNVSRVLAARGVPTTAVLPVGGAEGRQLLALLGAAGVAHRAVEVERATRVNVTVLEPAGHTTKVNAPAPPLTPADIDALVAATTEALRDPTDATAGAPARATPGAPLAPAGAGVVWVVCSGAFPAGVSADTLPRLVAAARAAGARVAVDTSGPALAAALDAGVDLVTPNGEELAELCGHPLPSQDAAVDAAVRVADTTGVAVLVTLGARGAVLVDADVVAHAVPPRIEPVNTAGAGDALLAGYLAADVRGLTPAGRLAQGVAWGTSACLSPGTAEVPADPVSPDAVQVTSRSRRAVGPRA